jgi:hypothetical protein
MNRGLTFAAHVALEFGLGVALAVLPFALDFDDGATIASVIVGAAVATVAISTSIGSHRISAHHGWDRAVVFLLAVMAVVSAISDFGDATLVFGIAAVAEALLIASTRYTPERGVPERIR